MNKEKSKGQKGPGVARAAKKEARASSGKKVAKSRVPLEAKSKLETGATTGQKQPVQLHDAANIAAAYVKKVIPQAKEFLVEEVLPLENQFGGWSITLSMVLPASTAGSSSLFIPVVSRTTEKVYKTVDVAEDGTVKAMKIRIVK